MFVFDDWFLHTFPILGATLGFVTQSFNILENASYIEVCIQITNIPADGIECDVGARIFFLDGPKAGTHLIVAGRNKSHDASHAPLSYKDLGVDFNTSTSGPLDINFPLNEAVNGAQQCVNVTIEDDMILEGQHIFQMQLTAGTPDGQIDFSPVQSNVVIRDNDGKH